MKSSYHARLSPTSLATCAKDLTSRSTPTNDTTPSSISDLINLIVEVYASSVSSGRTISEEEANNILSNLGKRTRTTLPQITLPPNESSSLDAMALEVMKEMEDE